MHQNSWRLLLTIYYPVVIPCQKCLMVSYCFCFCWPFFCCTCLVFSSTLNCCSMILQPGDMELRRNFEEEFAGNVWNSRLPKKSCFRHIFKCCLTCFIPWWFCCYKIMLLFHVYFFYFNFNTMIATMIFVGETRFFACTGVLIGRHKSITRILTSASLVRFANKNEIDRSLKVCTANHSIPLLVYFIFHILIIILSFIADSCVTSK